MNNKRNKKNNSCDNLILINRYAPSDKITFSSNYKRKLESQINYVDELPPFIKNRMNKRQYNKPNKPTKSINPHIIRPENIFDNYDDFSIKPSLLAKSKMKFSDVFSPKKTKYNTNFPIHYINNIVYLP